MGTSRWLTFRSSLPPGGILLLWCAVFALTTAAAVPGFRWFSEGESLRYEARSLQLRGERMAQGEQAYSSTMESRRRDRLTPAQLAAEERLRADSLRGGSGVVLAEAESTRREATRQRLRGSMLLLLGVGTFFLAVARTFPHWMAGPARVGGWLAFVGRSTGIVVVHVLLLFGLVISTGFYVSFSGNASDGGLVFTTLLAPTLAVLAGSTAGRVARWEKLPAAILGLAAVIALNLGLVFLIANSWVRPELGARVLHGLWAACGATAIGLGFFIGHRRDPSKA